MLNNLKNRESNFEKNKNIRQILSVAGLSLGIFVLIFWMRDLFPLGKGSVLMIDLHSQYVPLLYRFYDVVTGQKNLFMDLNVSGGAYLYADTINELLNPFNYTLLLFGRDRIYQAVNVLLALYGTAAATSCCYCLQKLWPGKREWNVPLSLCYAFSGFLAAQFQIIKWMYPVVLFPLFIVALFRLLREKKWGAYALLLGYQLILSLQLGAMTLFFTLFGSGFFYFYCRTKPADALENDGKHLFSYNKEECSKAVPALVLGTMVGVLLSAVVVVPNVLQLLSSARGGENQSYLLIMKQHGLDDLFERLYQVFHPAVSGTGLWFLGKKWCRDRKEKTKLSREIKYLLAWIAFLGLTIVAQPSNLIWHLGSYRCFPVRYAYMVLLAEIVLVKYLAVKDTESKQECEAVDAFSGGKRISFIADLLFKVLAVVFSGVALILAIQWALPISQGFSSLAVSQVPSVVAKLFGILALLFAAVFFAIGGTTWKKQMVTFVVCVSALIYFLFILLPQDYIVRQMNEAVYAQMTEVYNQAVGEKGAESEGHFSHGKDRDEWPWNAALVSGGKSLSGYFPSGSELEYASAMEKLGYLTPWVYTTSWGGSAVSDAVLGIEGEEQIVFSNGIWLDKTVAEIQEEYNRLDASDPLEAQNMMGEILTGQRPIQIRTLDTLKTDAEGNCIVELATDSNVYLDAGAVAAEILVWVNDKVLEFPESEAMESPHYLIFLGRFQAGEVKVKITDRGGNPLPVTGRKIGILERENWENLAGGVKELDGGQLAVDDRKGTIKVTLSDITQTKALMLPVAYADGWTCLVNGQKVDTAAVFDGFLGADVPVAFANASGTEITFSFIPPGLGIGFFLSMAALCILLVINVLGRLVKPDILREKTGKSFRKAAMILFVVVFSMGIMVVYVIPNAGLVVNMFAKVLHLNSSDDIVEQPSLRIARISEVEEGIRVDLVGENLMQKKGVCVSADSEESKEFSVERIRDGITDETQNRWSSANDWEDNEHWLMADFSEETQIGCVKLFWERTNACGYALEYSANKKDWQTVAVFQETAEEKEQTVFFETPIQARYLRLHVWNVTKEETDLSLYYQNISLLEMEVYGEPVGNLLIGRPAIGNGTDRVLELPKIEEGYLLRFGGADYENLIDEDGKIADTLSDVEVELGFILERDGLEWELPGMKVVIPGSVSKTAPETEEAETDSVKQTVRVIPDAVEWQALGGSSGLSDEVVIRVLESPEEENGLLNQMAELLQTELAGKASEKTEQGRIAKQNGEIEEILFVLENAGENNLGEEGCEIQIREHEIRIIANTSQGIRFGCVSLLDLLEDVSNTGGEKELPLGIMRDYPRYEVRGFGIDVGRRPVSMELLYQMVQELSANKMNTLQIHLNDNQIIAQSGYDGTLDGAKSLYAGFRLESDIQNHAGQGITSEDSFYTKEEFQKLIEDAKVYGVEIVPEIDTPAHCLKMTQVFPELGMTSDPETADILDISKKEAKQLAKDIWSEYLTAPGGDGTSVFEECEAVHLGMDEYYGEAEEYLIYLEELSEHVEALAPEKELRIWGSLSWLNGDLSGISRDLQMHIWDVRWTDPMEMYEEGFSLINSLSSDLYLIPGGGYDRLDVDYLEKNWSPNVYRTAERTWIIPAWSDRCLGACYMMWNDWAQLNGGEITEDGLYERFREPLPVIADKLW